MKTSYHRLLDVGHRVARAARRPRRAEAVAAAHPRRDERPEPRARPRPTASARRSPATRRATTTRTASRSSTRRSCAWRRTSTCATRWSTGRATSARVDGDPPAAMRYTEARLTPIADGDAAPTSRRTPSTSRPNYDETLRGAGGPAVGRARTCWSTARPASPSAWRPNIPPHNLTRDRATRIALVIDDPECSTRGADAASSRARTSRPAASSTAARASATATTTGRGLHRACARKVEHRGGPQRHAWRSSSPRSRTRSTRRTCSRRSPSW